MASQREPLFVKVDGYKVILREIESIKQIIANIREAMAVLKKVDDVKEKSIGTIIENVNRLNSQLAGIKEELPEIEGVSYEEAEVEPKSAEVDESLKQLHGQLKGLKDQLSALKA